MATGSFLYPDRRSQAERKSNEEKSCSKNELGIYADADGVVRADSLVVAQIFENVMTT